MLEGCKLILCPGHASITCSLYSSWLLQSPAAPCAGRCTCDAARQLLCSCMSFVGWERKSIFSKMLTSCVLSLQGRLHQTHRLYCSSQAEDCKGTLRCFSHLPVLTFLGAGIEIGAMHIKGSDS